MDMTHSRIDTARHHGTRWLNARLGKAVYPSMDQVAAHFTFKVTLAPQGKPECPVVL